MFLYPMSMIHSERFLMKYVLDAHTHTIASGHAYNTIREMACAGQSKGLELLGITEHAPAMPGTCHEFYFHNLRIMDRDAYAIPILLGSELNIMDDQGTVDLDAEVLVQLDYNIASLHPPCIPFMNKDRITQAVIHAIKNPNIHIIGHLDDARFEVDYDQVVRAAGEYRTLMEVNNSSMLPTSYRPNARENYKRMLEACEKYRVCIIMNSDAHSDSTVGRHDMSLALIEELGFPEDLIVNTAVEKFKSYIKK